MAQGIIQFAERGERPPGGTESPNLIDVLGPRLEGRANGQGRRARRAIQFDPHVCVVDPIVLDGFVERRQLNTGLGPGGRCFGEFHRTLGHRVVELAARRDGVDQPPTHGALALDPLSRRAEHVGEIAAHLALVHQTRQTTGARQHGEQRRLRKTDRRMAVVHEDDLTTGQRQLVTAAGARTVERCQVMLAASPRCVRELAEVDLEGVGRCAEHVNVGPGAKDPLSGAADDHAANARVLEP